MAYCKARLAPVVKVNSILLCLDISDILADTIAIPFGDNMRVQWSAPTVNQVPSNSQTGSNLNNLVDVVQTGNNNQQSVTSLDQLLRGGSVVIPLGNIQFQNIPSDKSAASVNATRNPNTNDAVQTGNRQASRIKATRVPIKFPTSNTAILIPTNLLSRMRRQTSKGFLLLLNPEKNQSISDIKSGNLNDRNVFVLMRRPSADTIKKKSPVKSNIGPNKSPVKSNIRPIKTVESSNQPIKSRVNIQTVPAATARNSIQNRRQQEQRRPQLPQRRQIPPRSIVIRPQQRSRQRNTVSRNRPLVQTVSSNGRFPRTQILRTGQTGQIQRPRPRVRVPARRRRPPPPPDPFTSRFSAGFQRGTNLLVQPPLENATFFNADGSRSTLNGPPNNGVNTLRRGTGLTNLAMPPTGPNFGNPFLPGPTLGGLGGFGMFR